MIPLNELFSQPHLAPFLLGCGVGGLTVGLAFLIAHQRLQRRQWSLALRLERAQEQARSHGGEVERLRTECSQLARECRAFETDNASLRTACTALEQQIQERNALLAETRRQIEQDFNLLAGQVITEKGEQLASQHASALTLLLRPFHDQLADFKKKVEEVYDREARDRVSMTKEIEQLKQLNRQLSSDASNLAEALRGSNKLQGQWGEMVLARLLEASGLRNGTEFALQVSLKTEDGATLQPDALVYLPDNRTVVIDAKVSLKAFAEAHNARDEGYRQQQIKLHLESVRRQIGLLARKQYHQLTEPGSLDFVLLFIPIEGAFLLAVNEDQELLVNAMQRQVILTCPSTLLAILRTVHHLWRMDAQNRNSLAIAKQAGNLYDKFVGFTEAFEEIGLRLNQTQQAWHTARNRLSAGQGNLIARTEALKALGVQAGKQLPATLRTSAAEGHVS
ncbi:MAG: DNA recombination protein RmuC [Desulfobulbus sp.]|uniref:DNA recombination protein RmuC n=1 Tax=Desulfobulbus sp. TaxID=895 RepID=UPI0028467156|nr:DNA recombination protein RmuC [Desulfobulbus sp.]MDR2551508.1 DNA recombination protein RmuC [Desulfobulbus sp.]